MSGSGYLRWPISGQWQSCQLEKVDLDIRIENDKLIGLISLSDLQRVSFIDAYGKEGTEDTPIYNMLDIKDLMIKKPLTASPQTTILEVSKLLASKEFHSLPVVEEEKLVGIITTTDLLHYFIELC